MEANPYSRRQPPHIATYYLHGEVPARDGYSPQNYSGLYNRHQVNFGTTAQLSLHVADIPKVYIFMVLRGGTCRIECLHSVEPYRNHPVDMKHLDDRLFALVGNISPDSWFVKTV